MVSQFSIIVNSILLASGVLAVPSSSSRLEARLSRHGLREKRQSPNIFYDGNWAGAALTKSEGTFTSVTGTFTIPTLNGSDSSATVWVGIDGPICRNAIFQAGVDLVVKDGKASYDPWVEWYPDGSYYFPEFPISGGDKIRSTVTASSKTSGNVIIENLTAHQTATKEVSSSHSLCQQDVEWVVEDFMQDIPFADFGTIKFTNATAFGPGGRNYTSDGANILYDIQQDNAATILTSVSVSGNTVSVKRV